MVNLLFEGVRRDVCSVISANLKPHSYDFGFMHLLGVDLAGFQAMAHDLVRNAPRHVEITHQLDFLGRSIPRETLCHVKPQAHPRFLAYFAGNITKLELPISLRDFPPPYHASGHSVAARLSRAAIPPNQFEAS